MTQTVKVIKSLMDKQGVSQKYMAEQIGVTPVAICRWMNGGRNPDIQYVEKMAKALGYKLSFEIEKRETMELNLKTFIAETKEVAKGLNEFADQLEQIEKKYAEPQKSEVINKQKPCVNIPFLLHKETGCPLYECVEAYEKAYEYLRSKAKIIG